MVNWFEKDKKEQWITIALLSVLITAIVSLIPTVNDISKHQEECSLLLNNRIIKDALGQPAWMDIRGANKTSTEGNYTKMTWMLNETEIVKTNQTMGSEGIVKIPERNQLTEMR